MGHPRIAVLTASIASLALLGVGCSGSSVTTGSAHNTDAGWILTETTANTFTSSSQERPTVAPTADGGMVIAWASRKQEDGSHGVYAQRLDAVGRRIGGEVHVNQRTAGAQDEPAIAVTESGAVWIAWSSSHTDGDGRAIMTRRFALTPFGLEPRSNEAIANETTAGDQATPSIAIGDDGGVLLAWTHAQGDDSLIMARAFDATGAPGGPESVLSSGSTIDRRASIATAQDGFVLTWTAQNADATDWNVMARKTDSLGVPVGDAIEVAPQFDSASIEPAIATGTKGTTTIAWMQGSDNGAAYAVYAQRFDAALAALTGPFEVGAPTEARRTGVSVTAAPDGRFAVLWNEEGEKVDAPVPGGHPTLLADIYAQRFDVDAAPVGDPFILHTTASGRQTMTIAAVAPRAIWTASDQLIAVWEGASAGDSKGVGVTIANPPALAAMASTANPVASHPDETANTALAYPEFDPAFVPEPRDMTARGVGSDFGFLGIPATGWNPPDPDIAVGPNHVIAVANGAIAWFTKDGTFEFQQVIAGGSGFWGAQGASGFVFDPVALYDVHSDRFVVAATERDDSNRSFLVLAISETSNPNDGWVKFRQNVESVGQGIDFPNLGVDEEAVYISVDFFGPTTGSQVFAYDKADLIAGTLSGQITQTAGGPVVTAGTYDYSTGNPNYYTLTAFNSGASQLRLQAIVDPLGGHNLIETFLNLPLPASSPPGAPQAGTTNLASTVDLRIKHAVYRNGSLWCSHAVNAGGFARVRWYEIEMNGWPQSGQQPSLRQSGDINPGPGIHTWFPDISVDDQGNAAISYNRSSTTEFIKIARAVRKAGDPLGTFRQSIINQVSTSPETGDRWGDYSGIHEDPTDPGVFWASLEYRTNSWRTWVAKFSAVNANPANFALLAPADNSTLATTAPTFEWEPATDAASYTVVISNNQAMTDIAYEQSGITGESFSPPLDALDCNQEYFWGVTADNAGGSSVSTPVAWSFTAQLFADISGDGVVDTADLGGLIGSFGQTQEFGDLNGDGIVDTADLALLIGAFGNVCE